MSDAPSKPCVLVADDDGNLRRIVCLFLNNANYETVEARNGRETVELVRSRRPDVVILDVMMPVLDGFTVCKMIKDDPQVRNTAIVVCTARNRKEDLIQAIKSGAEDYIIKPFTKDTVLAKVARAVAIRASRTPYRIPAPVNRRDSGRKSAPWMISWGTKGQSGLSPVYKTHVFDISLKGLSFEFVRCSVCTGYEQGTVHPQCLFAGHAKRFPESAVLDFVLSFNRDVVIEVEGKIAHVFQSPQSPRTEKVGVMFTQITPQARQIIQQYLDGKLEGAPEAAS